MSPAGRRAGLGASEGDPDRDGMSERAGLALPRGLAEVIGGTDYDETKDRRPRPSASAAIFRH